MTEIKIGTRGSRLALIQTEMVIRRLQQKLSAGSDLSFHPVTFTTRGEIFGSVPLSSIGGRGVFSGEIEEALVARKVDLAVHSAKDLPSEVHPDTVLLAVIPREDPSDVLIMPKDRDSDIPEIIGTGSPRREFLIKKIYPEAECRLLRGNVPTRLEKLRSGEYDAIILAEAGIKRLGLDREECFDYIKLPPDSFIPAGGQGIIALQVRRDHRLFTFLEKLVHRRTQTALDAERLVLRKISAGCHEAAGVYAFSPDTPAEKSDKLMIKYFLFRDGRLFSDSISGDPERYADLADSLLKSYSDTTSPEERT